MATPVSRSLRPSWYTVIAVVALVAVLAVHVAFWRAMSDTVRSEETTALMALVGLERSLEGLRDAVIQGAEADAEAETLTAATTAVTDRLDRLTDAHFVEDQSGEPRVFAEVERALVVTRAWRVLPEDEVAREAARAAISRAHAEVRESVLAAQQRAIAWSRALDRRVTSLMVFACVLWLGIGVGLLTLGVSFLRHRHRTSKRLLGVQEALVRSEHEARHDVLTGLANRRVFDGRLSEAIHAASAGRSTPALHLIDVDGLKAINDRFGHRAGDAVLMSVATSLANGVRDQDVVARFGGDEFAVIQQDASPITCRVLAHRLRQAVRRTTALDDGVTVVPEVSVGSAIYGTDGTTGVSLVGAADARLYGDKRRQRDVVMQAEPRIADAPLLVGDRS